MTLEPAKGTAISWRVGGEGLPGNVRRGVFPGSGADNVLQPGQWSGSVRLKEIIPERQSEDSFFTLSAGTQGRRLPEDRSKRVDYSTSVRFELEVLHPAAPPQLLRGEGTEGGTWTIAVAGTGRGGFAKGIGTVLDVAAARAKTLNELPWAAGPLPSRFAVATDLGGYGQGWGYGIRTADPRVPLAELAAVRQLGVNSLRAAPEFLLKSDAGMVRLRARLLGPVGYPVPKRKPKVPNEAAGCPFGPEVSARSERVVRDFVAQANATNAEAVWVLTQDEIASIGAHADDGNAHFARCARCAQGFRDRLKELGVRAADVGAAQMKDVRPLDVWRRGAQDFSRSSSLSRKLVYESWEFINYASARAFTEMRDGFAKANQEKREALASGAAGDAAKRPYIYSYALRSNTFLLGSSVLDFFEFYRHADNAMAWETSNRDSRVWQWESYLTDVQRVLKREMGLETGIYVKPHRGAPIQRMLAAISRGNELIYWYTYGPDYWKGDAFSNDLRAMRLTSKAAHLLGAAEPHLHGATSQQPRVAVVRPSASQAWLALEKKPESTAANENGKWIYTALQHAHVPVDPLDEKLLMDLDPSRYAVVYVSGTHVTRAAARSLKSYVEKGGTLVTSGYGLAFDETNSPLTTLLPVLGLKKREALESWCEVPAYGAGQLASLAACEEKHSVLAAGSEHALPLKVGREVLLPVAKARVLARYEDGKAAAIETAFGKGKSIVLGYFAGVEYAAPVMRHEFDMRRDFDARRRGLIVEPALAAGPVPIELNDDLVEPVLLKAAKGGWAVTLVNWAYADAAREPGWTGLVKHVRHLPLGQLDILVRGVTASKVRSVGLGKELPFEQKGDDVRIVLPELAEGDVVTIEPG